MSKETIEIQDKLIARALKNDQQAMYRLYKMYVQAMYNICVRMVVSQYDAEDIIQESFISAFKNLKSFRGDSSFGAWLKRIVINKSLNFLRQKKLEFIEISNMQVVEKDETDDIMENIKPEEIHEAIKLLPDKARVVLNLYLLEGYKHKEIAQILGINESTSKTQYKRAKQLLRESLKHKFRHEA